MLVVVLVAARWVSQIPLAALAGVLIATAIHMVRVASLAALMRSTRGDAAVLAITAAARLLSQRQPRTLHFTSATAGAQKRKPTVTTKAIASIDVYVNNRPVATKTTPDGTTQITVPATTGSLVKIEGFDSGGSLQAASQAHV